MTQPDELLERMQAIEGLVAEIQAAEDPRLRHAALELLQTVMDLHGAGLQRMIEILNQQGDSGRQVLESWTGIEPVSSILLLHDLHPDGLETRVRKAMERIEPTLARHGALASILDVSPDGVRLHLECKAPPAAVAEIRTTIEQVVHTAAPDAIAVVIEGSTGSQPNGFVPIENLMLVAKR